MVDILFVSHTNQPGGAEQTVSQYMAQSELAGLGLATVESGGVWTDLPARVHIAESGTTHPLVFMAWLRSEIQRTQARVVVPTTMRSALLCALAVPRGVRLVYWLHDGVGRDSAMSKHAVALTRAVTIPRSTAIIANSEWTKRSLGRRTLRKKAVMVCPPPCGLRAHDIAARRARELPQDRPIRLLYLGRIAPWKAPHVAVEALLDVAGRSERSFELTIAGGALFGENSYSAELMGRIEGASRMAHIQVLGHVSDVARLLDESDILVHTSTVPEPFGRVIVEAMAHGVPVIATDAGGPREILRQGYAGLLYSPGDALGLSMAIGQMEDADTYRDMSARALERSLDYADENLVPMLDEFLQRFE